LLALAAATAAVVIVVIAVVWRQQQQQLLPSSLLQLQVLLSLSSLFGVRISRCCCSHCLRRPRWRWLLLLLLASSLLALMAGAATEAEWERQWSLVVM
jgi:hypothetical protein